MSSNVTDYTCAQCGTPITDEPPSGAERKPCPKCGSMARSVTISVAMTVAVTAVGQVEVLTYPQSLLSVARSLIDGNHFGIAVVVLHMACEIATERSMSESYASKQIQYLEAPVAGLHSGYNLATRRIRKLYTALTGDEIQTQPFWQKFTDSSDRRNKILHGGLIIGKAEAEDSFMAVSDFITHLRK